MRQIKKYVAALRERRHALIHFDEEFYLSRYDDVAAAVARGEMPSALYHYKAHGRLEGRQAFPEHTPRTRTGEAFEQVEFRALEAIERRTRPLSYRIDQDRSPVVNVFVPTLDRGLFFGGYVAFVNFLMRLHAQGLALRFVICEERDFNAEHFAEFIADPRWRGAFDAAEFHNPRRSGAVLRLSEADSFIVYSCWTAHDAAPLAAACGKKIVFFIQEYEPSFHALDSFHFVAHSAYDVPHIAIFNSQALRAYFEKRGIGVFGRAGGLHFTFEHAILAPQRSVERGERKPALLFYARPEAHAARNLFSVGVLALRECVRRGVITSDWTVTGIGATSFYRLDLGSGVTLNGIPKAPPARYLEMVRDYTLGLSLMSAPHPGVVHFEWVAAGLPTVINTTAERGEDFFRQYSAGLIPATPSVAGIADAVERAVSHRVPGADEAGPLPCPTSWDEAFPLGFMERVTAAMTGPAARIGGSGEHEAT